MRIRAAVGRRVVYQTREDVCTAILEDQQRYAKVTDTFHQAWYQSFHTWGMTWFEGVRVFQNPLDLWLLQEVIWETSPTLIIETGTYFGGSALFYARCLDRLRRYGRVVTIDTKVRTRPSHPRVTYLTGSSLSKSIMEVVLRIASRPGTRVMVVLDSDHHEDHVLLELDAYAHLVTRGQFLVVQDTNLNGHPIVNRDGVRGPGDALARWLPYHQEFERDVFRERYMLTFNPGGWLRRVA